MPVIPQYSAGNPANVSGPVLERERTARLDNSEMLNGISRLSQRIGQRTVPLANIDPETGQAGARAIQGLGQHIEQFGGLMYEIRKREEEARNYRDVHQAQIAMEREAGDFEIWKEQNPNPQEWEPEWNRRSQNFSQRYFQGRELTPKAEEQIRLRMESFNNRQSINVGVAAVKETTKQAREALEADIIRSKDPDDIRRMAQYGERQGWFPADYAAQLEVNAINRAEAEELERQQTLIETDLLNGNIQAVREGIRNLDIPQEEKANQLAKFENRHAENIVAQEISELTYEDPVAMIQRLESGADKELSNATREKLKTFAYQMHLEERGEILASSVQGIDNRAIKTIEQLNQSLWGAEASDQERATLEARLRGELVENAKQAREFQTRANSYDPASDPYGVTAAAIRDEVILTMPEGDRRDKILAELSRRASGDPITMIEEAKQKAKERYYAQIEARAEWKVPASEVDEVKLEDGRTGYFVADPTISENDPNFFTQKSLTLIGPRFKRGRLIQLTPEDRFEVGKKNVLIDDLQKMNEAYRKADRRFEQLSIEEESGNINSYDEYQERARELFQADSVENARNFLELKEEGGQATGLPGVSAPPSNSLFGFDPIESLNALGNATGY